MDGAPSIPGPAATPSTLPADFSHVTDGLSNATVTEYLAPASGGIAHVTYWDIKPGSDAYEALSATEQAKLPKLQACALHSRRVRMALAVPGLEVTGTLSVTDGLNQRRQDVALKIPANWHGGLVVAGPPPGTRNELASDAVLATWVVAAGHAYLSGNKGMTNDGADGNATLLSQQF